MIGHITALKTVVDLGKHFEKKNLENKTDKKISFGCTTCSKTTYRADQNKNTANLPFAQVPSYLVNVSKHADYSMFNQFSNAEKQYVLQTLGNLNEKVHANTLLGKGAVNMVNTLATNLGTSGFPDGIDTGGYLKGLQSQINNAHSDREGMRVRIKAVEADKDNIIAEHAKFHTKFTNLGDSDKNAKLDREELHRKIDSVSTGNFLSGILGSTTGVLALGAVAYLLFMRRGK